MLFGMVGAFGFSIGCYNAMWARHLELKGSVVRRHIELEKCGSSKQCVIATAERDDIEDQFFASKIVRRSEDHF